MRYVCLYIRKRLDPLLGPLSVPEVLYVLYDVDVTIIYV